MASVGSIVPDPDSFFPLEFLVSGVPVSHQAKGRGGSKGVWMHRVQDAASLRIAQCVEWSYLEDKPLALTIFYFAVGVMKGDIDNIVKPIMDALKEKAYNDDSLIERVTAQKFEADVDWSIDDDSPMLQEALIAERPVVYIRVDDDLAWRRL